MLGKVKLAAAGALVATMCSGSALAAGEAIELPSQSWPFKGIFGTFDRAALQRGFQIYQEVCAGCHSIRLVAYRNLSALGYNEDEIKAIAAEATVIDGPDEEGEMFERPGKPADRFVPPFPNDQAAAASNNNAIPPDLSLITKARKSGHDYMYALMVGYEDEAPDGVEIGEGQYYNTYFPRQRHLHAAAAERRRHRIYRRHAGDRRSNGARHHHIPGMDGAAGARGTQAHGRQGHPVFDRADGDAVCGQAQGLGGPALIPPTA